jgi:hypothetical protein
MGKTCTLRGQKMEKQLGEVDKFVFIFAGQQA